VITPKSCGFEYNPRPELSIAFEKPMSGTLIPEKSSYIVRFAGDSGDGIQLQGQQFTVASAEGGHDLATLPDFPAEIRAPAGTRYGVSAFQIQFGGDIITTPGEEPDVLIAFNPAALMVNLPRLRRGATIFVDSDAFTSQRLKRAELTSNPLEDGSLKDYNVIEVAISSLTQETVKPFGMGSKDSLRCKNLWALGLMMWLFDQPRASTQTWIASKFASDEQVRDANLAALNAGHAYGETIELNHHIKPHPTPEAALEAREYRTLTGAEALALGLVAAGELADTPLLFCSYPITPASSVLHNLTGLEDAGIATFQAEDEIAAVCAAIGASYAGKLGVTSSSGPGIALKTEAIGLAVATELPLLIVNSQRAGPSTGMPTKTEQSDLYQAVYGRNGDTPIPVLATRSPADCFDTTIEAARIALRHMTPVMLLTDGYIANASELWPIPDLDDYDHIANWRPEPADTGDVFERDPETLARRWASPGHPGFIHRVGGIEKDIVSGNISYDAANHQAMTELRRDKVKSVADYLPDQELDSGVPGGLAIVAWGSTWGSVYQAVQATLREGLAVAHIHLRHINPLPANLAALLGQFQLATLLRDRLNLSVEQLNQVNGQPLSVATLEDRIRHLAPRRIQEASNE
jgi:2-oxoglutarate ferredoxin oxidoreductase subunit alpha